MENAAEVVAITGATGTIGRALTAQLRAQGKTVYRLTRSPTEPQDLRWDFAQGISELKKVERLDQVIHLAGESIFGRWTQAKRDRIYQSRVDGTRFLCEELAARDPKPSVLISASGSNAYPIGSPEVLDESGPWGDSFLSGVCRDWERATKSAETAGIRVIHLRTSMVLARDGGALKMMLPPFRFGLGGRLGSGHQRMSWISRHDHLRIIQHCLETPDLSGPINACAPQPVSNREFTAVLARQLHRPAIFPVPSFAIKAVFGSALASEVLLADLAAISQRLPESGFAFDDPDLATALARELTAS